MRAKLLVLFGLVVALGVGIVMWLTGVPAVRSLPGDHPSVPTVSKVAPMAVPLLTDVDGDGGEDLVLRTPAAVRLVDGSSFATRWTIDAAGTFMLVGKRGVVLDGTTFRAIDLTNGNDLQRSTLTAEAVHTCIDGAKLIVEQRDGAVWVYDAATDQKTMGAPAEACRPSDRPQACVHARAECSLVGSGNLRLAADRHETQVVFAPGAPGSRRAVSLVGFDDKGKESYREVIDPDGHRVKDVDLADGKLLICAEGVRAFDALSGSLAWDRPGGARMRGGAHRAYVSIVRDDIPLIDVIAVKDGALVKSLAW